MGADRKTPVELRFGLDGALAAHMSSVTIRTALQPIFELHESTLQLVAFEALARVSDPSQVANETFFERLSHDMRHHVEYAAREIHFVNAAPYLDGNQGIFINFNPALFDLPNIETRLIKQLQELATKAGILAGNVICEITEQKGPGRKMLVGIVAAMRQAGFAIAVDDFGANQSNLERVKVVDPDVVKFDAAWVQFGFSSSQKRRDLAEQVAAFRGEGRLVLFEGIEEDWQVDAAREAGAQLLQGFGLSRPQIVPATFQQSVECANKLKAVAKRTAETGEAKTIKWITKPRFQSG